jgi:RNA polymerase sigma-70 factor, ECF subfamily
MQSQTSSDFDSGQTRLSLLSRAKARDSIAWRELVELYGPLIAFWCRQRSLDVHATADCVQEVFASVARNLVRFRPKHSSGAFRAWLWTIARNKIIDANRTRNSHPVPAGGSSANLAMQQVLDPIQMDEAEQLSEPNDHQQNNALVQRAMAQVAIDFEPRTWQVFTRTVLDQTATGVVAEEFGISQAAVRQIRSRVLRRIRQQLGDME